MELLLMLLFGLLFGFSSVGSVDQAEATASAEPSAAAEPAISEVQLQFMDREQLPSCGEFVAEPNGLADSEVRPGWQCLKESASGRGGEMVVYTTTTEGDPVYTYVRVTPQRRMEIYVDPSLDSFGSREWTYESCSVEDASFRQGCP